MVRPALFLLSTLLILAGCAGFDTCAVRSSSPYPHLRQQLDAIVGEKLLPHTTAGIKITSLKSGETIYESNSRLLMTPASNLKLFTAAAALGLLGAGHPVTTTVWLGGADNRDLYLKGCGDALLTTGELRELAAAAGRPALPAGSYRLFGDLSCFDDLYWGKGWSWDDEPDPDEMYITPLSVDGNAVTVAVSPADRPGDPAAVTVTPAASGIPVRNTAMTAGMDATATLAIDRRPGDRENLLNVSGTIPLGAPAVVRRVSVWMPENLVLSLYREFLQAGGISVSETGFGATPPGAQLRAVQRRTVGDLVTVMLRESHNLAAESLLKLVGREATGRAGSAEDGAGAVRRYLAERGVPTGHLVLVDGSGVSRYNLTSADTIVRLLAAVYRDRTNYPVFSGSLAVAGVSGTLAKRMKGTAAAGRVRAKSGTMNGVSALSGYVTPESGEPLAFSILVQNYAGSAETAREVQDRICILLSGLRPDDN